LSWPKEHHGQERTPLEQLAFMEEMERAGAPRVGAKIQATALMLFVTPAQQEKYLPEVMRGDAICGIGYSEAWPSILFRFLSDSLWRARLR
jgi:alkylation response protein AidB-like acyl-CoA dehydrogenase